MDRSQLPKYGDLMLPVLRAVVELGGSGAGREITSQVVESQGFDDEQVSISYENRDKSIVIDRIDWARSYCKLGGVLESPKRSLYLVTDLGEEIAALPDEQASSRLKELDREVRKSRRKKTDTESNGTDDEVPDLDPDDSEDWKADFLHALHTLSPDAFERFTLYLLRSFGMKLIRQGGPGDEGVDGLGTAPLTDVLTTTVAVQAKRYEPSRTIGREVVALFQSDASACGAEHGVLITTARFSKPAEQSALGRTPTIDLIDGDRLAELCLQQEIGVQRQPVVDVKSLERFESGK